MDQNDIKTKLNKVVSNCQYLTNIEHYNKDKIAHRHQQLFFKQLCPISIAKVVVQLSYLLYTCSILNLDIYLSSIPLFVRNYQHTIYQAKYFFYLACQDQEGIKENVCQKCKFTLFKINNYNKNFIQFISKIVKSVEQYFLQKHPQHQAVKISISKFLQFLKTQVQPKIMDNYKVKIIKLLETHEFFIQHSDLLKNLRGSLLYLIKKNQQVIMYLINLKYSMKKKILFLTQKANWLLFYKQLDSFLLYLAKNSIIQIDKSLSKDNKTRPFIVGEIQSKQNKNHEKYYAKFYISQKIQKNMKSPRKQEEDQSKVEKNPYTIQYDVENLFFYIRYVTILQSNAETIDLFSHNCANIAFQNKNISIQTLQLIRNPSKLAIAKKYIVFKTKFVLESNQQPFTKILFMVQHVTICAKIFTDLIRKMPVRDFSAVIMQYTNRCNHLHKLFVDKARQYYQSL